jgi:hypothetical protein
MSARQTVIGIATALAILGIGHAAAQQPGGKAGRDRVCAEDAKKFCSNVRPGAGRMYQCLTSHSAELAPACRERMEAAKARWDKFMQACKGDIEKACKTIPPGQGRVLSCLKGRESDLSPECKAEFAATRRNPAITQ